jgi:superfamily I DNA/RNA helicase
MIESLSNPGSGVEEYRRRESLQMSEEDLREDQMVQLEELPFYLMDGEPLQDFVDVPFQEEDQVEYQQDQNLISL